MNKTLKYNIIYY